MPKIKWASYEEGDILDWADKVDVIGHQVNCFGVMGGGLALQIAERWPIVLKEYQWYINTVLSWSTRKNFLGHCQIVQATINDTPLIANLFGQYDVGGGLKTDYEALRESLKNLKRRMQIYRVKKLALPVNLGCGLAGGNWDIVQNIIENVFEDRTIKLTLVSYKPKVLFSQV